MWVVVHYSNEWSNTNTYKNLVNKVNKFILYVFGLIQIFIRTGLYWRMQKKITLFTKTNQNLFSVYDTKICITFSQFAYLVKNICNFQVLPILKSPKPCHYTHKQLLLVGQWHPNWHWTRDQQSFVSPRPIFNLSHI